MSVVIHAHGIVPRIVGLAEHAAAVIVGLILMVVGLGLSVTMVFLPVGLIAGLGGVALVVSGLFAHFDSRG